ncbi:tripartite tricarboxylate transporter TctB family protein [Allopusillimonas ginsengisoli]|uniref:tripartite tricarboxylate transporter TctB family protein n=1 Tax=Allopusillimonas ginsengisoli TaxID=453575 RepID=UPI0010C19946|nr:hypothetical protein D7I39_12410 [Allopusillimonas ginsengisoli]
MQHSDKKDISFALLSMVIGVFVTLQAFSYSYDSSVLLRGLALAMTLMSVAYFVLVWARSRRRPTSESDPHTQPKSPHGQALLVFALVVGCAVLVPLLGFLASFFLFIYASQVLIAKKHRMLHFFYAIGLSFFIFMVFFGFLGVSLPDSLLPIDQFFKFF